MWPESIRENRSADGSLRSKKQLAAYAANCAPGQSLSSDAVLTEISISEEQTRGHDGRRSMYEGELRCATGLRGNREGKHWYLLSLSAFKRGSLNSFFSLCTFCLRDDLIFVSSRTI